MAYADPDYDPVKAHEYYMKHRKLKGRRSQKGFSQTQKEQYSYVSNQLREQRKKTISEGVEKENQSRQDQLEQIRKTRNAQKALLSKDAQKKMEMIKIRMKYMSSDQKERMAGIIRSQMNKIQERLTMRTEALNERTQLKKHEVRETAKANKASLRAKANADYESAMDAAWKRIKG